MICFLACQKESQFKTTLYQATDLHNNKATLLLKVYDDSFYGDYVVHYANKMRDSGMVKGEIINDSLIGRYTHISFSGAKKVSPFLLLKRADTLKLGTGQVFTYMHIPFYKQSTITFNDSSFQFLPQIK